MFQRCLFTRRLAKDSNLATDLSAVAATGINVLISSFNIPSDVQLAIANCSPVIQRGFEVALETIGSNRFSNNEKKRLAHTFLSAAQKAAENNSKQKSLAPSFESSDDLEDILEDLLCAASDDSQEKKDEVYGRFIGNFPYQGQFNKTSVYMLARIIRELSYDELLLLSILYELGSTNFESINTCFVNTENVTAGEICYYFMHFRNLGLTVRTFPFSTGSTIGTIKLSSLGKGLCEMMELLNLDPEERTKMQATLDLYNRFQG